MESILIIDSACTKTYNSETLTHPTYSGTLNTVINIAEKLGEHFQVYVLQRYRLVVEEGQSNVIYAPLEYFGKIKHVTATILLRKGDFLPALLEYYPKAKHFYWYHDLASHKMVNNFSYMERAHLKIIAVSKYHQRKIEEIFIQNNLPVKNTTFDYVYNPISDDLFPDDTPLDAKKLFFASAPIKGLNYTLEVFDYLLTKDPAFNLYLANPSPIYMPQKGSVGNIHFLGVIPQKEVIKHMRSSLCIFYPNFVLPETFGLVLAEANAVGTPVITHNLGAAKEVLGNGDQFIDVTDKDKLVERIISWSNGKRPKVKPNEAFRLSNVVKKWFELLER